MLDRRAAKRDNRSELTTHIELTLTINYLQAHLADCSQGGAAATSHIPAVLPSPTHQALQSKVSG